MNEGNNARVRADIGSHEEIEKAAEAANSAKEHGDGHEPRGSMQRFPFGALRPSYEETSQQHREAGDADDAQAATRRLEVERKIGAVLSSIPPLEGRERVIPHRSH